MQTPFLESNLPFPKRQGKVRDVYDLGDTLLIVSTDRISAFDWILPNGVPDKGRILTQLSQFWFNFLREPNHYITCDLPESIREFDRDGNLNGRTMVVKKAQVIPFECVVRGYLEGSGWRDYQSTQNVCGVRLPKGLSQCEQLTEPIFTPATKAESGHDENVPFANMVAALGAEVAGELLHRSLQVYTRGSEWASQRGLLIADTKFEWGWYEGNIILIDEVLTPDSSRFWPKDTYQKGRSQASFDKQFVREFLMKTNWDRNSPPPDLPEAIVEQTRAKYIEAFERITGTQFSAETNA